MAVVVSAIVLAAVGDASAETKSFNLRCTMNTSLRACASLRVTTTAAASGGTNVVIMVRNLQGTAPDQLGASIITRVGLTAPYSAIGTASGLVVGNTGSVGAVNLGDAAGPSDKWQNKNEGINGPVQFSISTTGARRNGGIIGCNVAGVSPNDYFQTCSTLGQTGFVTFSFHTSGAWNASQAEVGVVFQGVSGLPHAAECRTEVGPGDPSFCAQVTPEPIGMALLGTGLLGLGGAGFLRRRGRLQVANG